MELCKILIMKLDNWVQWRYRMTRMLNDIDGIINIVEGKVWAPERGVAAVGDAVLGVYNQTLREYERILSTALLLINSDISDEILVKVMRFSYPKYLCTTHPMDELHRLYDGMNDGWYDI